MTSNTTPSGECFANNSDSGHPPYYAFDTQTGGSYYWQYETSNLSHVGYSFTSPVKIYCFDYMIYANTSVVVAHSYSIKGSNDRSTWSTLYEGSLPAQSNGVSKQLVTAVSAYTDIALFLTSNNTATSGRKWANAQELQFYGRKDV